MNPRLFALKIIHQVVSCGKSLNQLSATISNEIKVHEDRALCRELVYGVIRRYFQLDFIVSKLLSKPLKEKDSDVHALLLLGIYQIMYMRIPDHAAVNETVKLTAKLKKPWARGLVNGVLRNFLRERNQLEKQAEQNLEAHYAHPQWLIEIIQQDWPEEWQQTLQANNRQGQMSLRINQLQKSREQFQQELREQGIQSSLAEFSQNGLILDQAKDPRSMQGFAEGEFSVQDEAAQLAAELLDLQPDMRVLDACAAPGGKTAAMLEYTPAIKVTALDVDQHRMEKVDQTLQRLHLSASLTVADAAELQKWWDGNAFDRILLDAPCSGTGVIRRNPDIKIHRRLEDLDRLVDNQQNLLKQLWSVLKPGGKLLYATCSIIRKENENQIAEFIASHGDAELIPIEARWGRQASFGRQILPGEHGMDGFFYALLRKSGNE